MDAWKVKPSTTKVPANDFESRFRKNKHGLKGMEVEISGYVDADNNPFLDAGGGLRPGVTRTMFCYLIKGGWAFSGNIDIFEVEVGNEVDGKVALTARGETNGAYTMPGGATP